MPQLQNCFLMFTKTHWTSGVPHQQCTYIRTTRARARAQCLSLSWYLRCQSEICFAFYIFSSNVPAWAFMSEACTYTTKRGHRSMARVEFEPTIPVLQWSQFLRNSDRVIVWSTYHRYIGLISTAVLQVFTVMKGLLGCDPEDRNLNLIPTVRDVIPKILNDEAK